MWQTQQGSGKRKIARLRILRDGPGGRRTQPGEDPSGKRRTGLVSQSRDGFWARRCSWMAALKAAIGFRIPQSLLSLQDDVCYIADNFCHNICVPDDKGTACRRVAEALCSSVPKTKRRREAA